jgi:4-hydroxyacetophenone monooxygenase
MDVHFSPQPERRSGALDALLQDEDALRRQLAQVDTVPLLMVLTQFTGESMWLDRFEPYITGAWSFEETAPEGLKAETREALIAALRNWGSNRPMPGLPPAQLLQRMLSVCVGKHVPPEYFDLVLEEINIEEQDRKTVGWRRMPAPEVLDRFDVLVIGAGFSGIGMAAKLKQAGIKHVVIEKNDNVGGTWYENSYPGCGVDTANHFYSYSFLLNPDWNHYFAKRDEIFDYIQRCYAQLDVASAVRLNEEVESAVWCEEDACWEVTIRRKDDSQYTLRPRVVVSAVGQLNRPAYPVIPGLASFKGPAMHTARWDHRVDLTGKRVAMIGTGASGMQVGPSIAPIVGKLTIFQRSPHWAAPNRLYFASVSESKRWALQSIPFYAKWFRFLLFWASSDGFHSSLRMDPDWPEPARALNATNNEMRKKLVEHITQEVGGNPELLKKVIPDYPPYGKRMLRDNHWYRMLTRSNVELLTGAVERITETGVVDSEGREHPADVLVLATGFQARRMLSPMHIVGRDGVVLRDQWGEDDPRAYLGITMPHFPNFFVIYGPNTNLAHGGSAIFHSECQIRYIMQAVRELAERNESALEVREEPFEQYNRKVDAAHRELVWSHPGVTSWYKNKHGRVTANSPWRLVDYRNMTAEFQPGEYDFGKKKTT